MTLFCVSMLSFNILGYLSSARFRLVTSFLSCCICLSFAPLVVDSSLPNCGEFLQLVLHALGGLHPHYLEHVLHLLRIGPVVVGRLPLACMKDWLLKSMCFHRRHRLRLPLVAWIVWGEGGLVGVGRLLLQAPACGVVARPSHLADRAIRLGLPGLVGVVLLARVVFLVAFFGEAVAILVAAAKLPCSCLRSWRTDVELGDRRRDADIVESCSVRRLNPEDQEELAVMEMDTFDADVDPLCKFSGGVSIHNGLWRKLFLNVWCPKVSYSVTSRRSRSRGLVLVGVRVGQIGCCNRKRRL